MTIGERLRDVISASGMSLSAFSKKAGIPYRSLQNYVANEQKPGTDALLRITGTLGVSIDWLLTGNGNVYLASSSVPENDTQELKILRMLINKEPAMGKRLLAMAVTIDEGVQNYAKLAKLVALINAKKAGALGDVDLRSCSPEDLDDRYRQVFGDTPPDNALAAFLDRALGINPKE